MIFVFSAFFCFLVILVINKLLRRQLSWRIIWLYFFAEFVIISRFLFKMENLIWEHIMYSYIHAPLQWNRTICFKKKIQEWLTVLVKSSKYCPIKLFDLVDGVSRFYGKYWLNQKMMKTSIGPCINLVLKSTFPTKDHYIIHHFSPHSKYAIILSIFSLKSLIFIKICTSSVMNWLSLTLAGILFPLQQLGTVYLNKFK